MFKDTIKNLKIVKYNFLLPIISLISIILFFVISRNASLKTFWIGGLVALFIQFLLEKDKKNFGKKCVENLKDNTLLSCSLIFILAGILSSLFKNAGISDSLLLLCSNIGFDAKFLPVVIFTICCIFSTACGTSTGTITMAVPIFLPLSTSLGCNPALILGAIAAGSFLGDNLSPISDTTIISVNAVKADMYSTVKERLKISLLAFFISSIIYIILGANMIETSTINLTSQGSYSGLIFLVIPILMFVFLSKTKDVISTLLFSNLVAIIISLIFGFVGFSELFSKNSIIIQGIESVFGVVAFWIFLFIIIGCIPKNFFERFAMRITTRAKSNFKSNLCGVLMIIASILLVSNNTAAMSMMSCMVDKFFKNKSPIDKANIFDGLSCAVPGMLPYNTAFMVMVSLAFESGCLPETFSIIDIPIFSINSICLLIIYVYIALKKEQERKLLTSSIDCSILASEKNT